LNQINERAPRRNTSDDVLGRLEQIIARGRSSRLTGTDGDWLSMTTQFDAFRAVSGQIL